MRGEIVTEESVTGVVHGRPILLMIEMMDKVNGGHHPLLQQSQLHQQARQHPREEEAGGHENRQDRRAGRNMEMKKRWEMIEVLVVIEMSEEVHHQGKYQQGKLERKEEVEHGGVELLRGRIDPPETWVIETLEETRQKPLDGGKGGTTSRPLEWKGLLLQKRGRHL